MFVSRVKAKGNYYFYLYSYHSDLTTRKQGLKPIYSLGRFEKAITKLNEWEKDFNGIPKELIDRGISKDDLSKWKNKLRLLTA